MLALCETVQRGNIRMSQQNVTLAQSLYAAFGRGDIPTVLGAMDPNIEWDEPAAPGYPYGGVHRGPNGVAGEVFAQLPVLYEEFIVIPQEFIDAGDKVIALGEFRGRGKASGTTFQVGFAHVLTFRDGRWTRFQNYTDTGTMVAALK